ncbi:MAG: hypothetical protein JSU01_08525 [Bacteroidetes bacterium]|nr:hypothetical protein [Bacteroidota bacterium]
MTKKLSLFIVISLLSCTATVAQTTVDIDFSGLGFLDNREYKDFVARSRTYSGTRIAPDIGLNVDSMNHFVVGVNAIHEFGAQPFFLAVDPVAYYKFTGRHWLFFAGEFPREGNLSNYPRAFLNDTMRYYRPNVQGLLAQFHSDHFMETGWIDWMSRQTATQREEFLWGAYGKWRPSLYGPFYISHYAVLLHDAGAAILLPDDHIVENGGLQLRLGLDLSKKQHLLDSLTIEAGYMETLSRERGFDGWQTSNGFIMNIYASWGRFSILNEFYDGQPGQALTFGDAFYTEKFYDRLDMMFNAFNAKGLTGQFILSVHRTPGFTSNQEAFRLTYNLGRRKIAQFKQ